MTPLDQQVAFLIHVDALKTIERSNILRDHSRAENSAEHSWHVALWAMILVQDAAPEADVNRVIAMLLIHDLVEIDVGDHPIHLKTDWEAVARAEDAAARRLFDMLPSPLGADLLALWREFEAQISPDARAAKMIDSAQPLFQTVYGMPPPPEHCAIVRDNLSHGRARALHHTWPDAAAHVQARLDGDTPPPTCLSEALAFLNTADALKTVVRATPIADNSRRENSAEHSWHLALFALILADQAPHSVDMSRVIQMLLIHDIVEIDAGDVPIYADATAGDQEAAEQAAAMRLFGLLPDAKGSALLALWHEFEAAETPDARFAKALDRFQPPNMNLASGGGSWAEYNVTIDQVRARVGTLINRGAPTLWAWLNPKIAQFFETHRKSG